MLLSYISRVDVSFICNKHLFDSVRFFAFFVRDKKDSRPKGAFSIYFIFFIIYFIFFIKRIRMLFKQEKYYAKSTEKVY